MTAASVSRVELVDGHTMLNQIIAALGRAATAGLADGVSGGIMRPGSARLTQASQQSPRQAQNVVRQAHRMPLASPVRLLPSSRSTPA